jgi:signal transduction histidine kinase
MNSIRQRLAFGLISGLTLLVAILAAVVLPMIQRALLAEFDYALRAKAHALTSFADATRRGVNLQFTEANLPEFQPGPDAEFFQVTMADGTVLARSPSLGSNTLRRPPGFPSGAGWNNELPNGVPGRALSLRFAQDGANDIEVTFARSRERLNNTLAVIHASAAAGGIATVVLISIVVNRVVRHGLQPVHALAQEVTGITSASLDRRVSTAALPKELQPIALELNRLLEHLQAAFARERRFTADAAHELSTPIAELRALTDVALRWRDDPAVTGDLATKANEIAQQMQHIVRVLLALSRAENARAEIKLGNADLSVLFQELTNAIEARCRAKGIELRCQIQPDVRIRTDATLLRALLFNVLDNAAEYTPANGAVDCTLRKAGEVVIAETTNAQADLVADDLPHLFEPLWRKDSARTNGQHCGVGLALVKSYAEALGARVQAELLTTGELRVTVTLPISGPVAAPGT